MLQRRDAITKVIREAILFVLACLTVREKDKTKKLWLIARQHKAIRTMVEMSEDSVDGGKVIAYSSVNEQSAAWFQSMKSEDNEFC